jgi:folate-binding protein YgfZ
MPEIAEGSADAWGAVEIRSGLYRIDREDVGEFTPQAINYDLAGLVSFTKGCYTGQEVIARLHYRGQSKRRLGVFATVTPDAASAADAPPRGEPVVDESGERVGELLRAARTPDGDTVLACQLRAESVDSPNLLMAGTPLRPLPAPYPDAETGAAG